jgi:hypothetical protein
MTTPDAAPDMPIRWYNTADELLALLTGAHVDWTVSLDRIPLGIRIGVDRPVYALNDVRMLDGVLVLGAEVRSAPQEPGPDREREVAGKEREPEPDEVDGVGVDAERGKQEADGGSESEHGRGVPGGRVEES